mmetsp:Transcript_26993/g.40854  ORF Transcript_26993/g.40854 Transcript_26993/m.40854 type:complete len:140 (-) Transcript_26993:185-604(-)|eukprot:CAMPEP_0178907510 /NCGR_PEP_ID=MMETSP0786-20121207/7413_1 /TAXON_ID=186022 /ORGANISM="Thalassionema frauenfeldii, Strain CCMP 1798" /LENGTH=139 /DNA_ID=CAMNT_0020579321 /DNA_START=212 /DNA_END=631 /DNA_ORIENTATION=+
MSGKTNKTEKKEAPSAGPSATVLFVQGLFLAGCGIYGSASRDWDPKVMHSAYAGVGCAITLIACALATISGSYKLYMIGVHLALLLQTLFVLVFGMQTYKSSTDPVKTDRLPLFVVMLIGSIVGLASMVALKPKKKKES